MQVVNLGCVLLSIYKRDMTEVNRQRKKCIFFQLIQKKFLQILYLNIESTFPSTNFKAFAICGIDLINWAIFSCRISPQAGRNMLSKSALDDGFRGVFSNRTIQYSP